MNKEIINHFREIGIFEEDILKNINVNDIKFLKNISKDFEQTLYKKTKRYDELMKELCKVFDKYKNATNKEELEKQEQQLEYEIFSIAHEQAFIVGFIVSKGTVNLDKLKNINYEEQKDLQALYMKYRKQIFTPTKEYKLLKEKEDEIMEETLKVVEQQGELLEKHDKIYNEYKAIEFYQYSLFGYFLGKQFKDESKMKGEI